MNEAFVRRFFPHDNPLGQKLIFNDGGGNPCEIVGIVGDTRPAGLDAPPSPEVYRPIYEFCPYDLSLVLRTKNDPGQIVSRVRREVLELDKDRSLYNIRKMRQEKFEYSNVGMALLGHILALKTGTNYEALVVEQICRPLKMNSTRITLSPELRAGLARGHDQPVSLGSDWKATPEWRDKTQAPPPQIPLLPGKHTIRFAPVIRDVTVKPKPPNNYVPSNPVEIEIN